jgi:quinohemoprotein ethanol dehydrogenase
VSAGKLATSKITPNISRLMVFKLGAKGQLTPMTPSAERLLDPPPLSGTQEQLALGAKLYTNSCSVCHGNAAVAGALNPDLRHSVALGNPKLWQEIVHDGLLSKNGMVAWKGQFNPEQIEAIRLYAIQRANEDKALGDH